MSSESVRDNYSLKKSIDVVLVFIVNFEHISQLFMVFEQGNISWIMAMEKIENETLVITSSLDRD